LATPLWAGVWALFGQAYSDGCGGVAPSGGFEGYLYPFAGPGVFHTAASMGSDFQHVGLGSPNITNLVAQIGCTASITSISPTSGKGSGGTTVTVDGTNFIGVTGVTFGGAKATNVTIHSDSKLTADSPAALADQVQVEVAGAARFAFADNNTFSYLPEIKTVSPNSGPFFGGTSVKVTGLALSDKYTFNFGGSPATQVSCSGSTTCTMMTPAAPTGVNCTITQLVVCPPPPPPGTVAVQVIASVGNSNSADLFTYQGPSISSFGQAVGPTSGGLEVEVYGVSLKAGMTVTFGDASSTAIATSCSGSIACVLKNPPHAIGPVPLTVTVDGLTSAPSTSQFTFAVFPTITSISPNIIPINTGSSDVSVTLTIKGTGLRLPGTPLKVSDSRPS
jgi:large repetitive protein